MNILIFLIILVVLVISHEFGHFIVAKKSGIRVDEFSFGFPPKLFGKKIGETTYNFNALPFGGYVKIYGQGTDDFPGQNGEEVTLENKDRSFSHKPKYIRAFVLLAGVVMNLLVAWLLLSVGFMSGLPTSVSGAPEGAIVTNQALTVTSVVADSPAHKAEIKTGDKITKMVSGKDVLENPLDTDSVINFVKSHGSKEINITYIRASEVKDVVVTPKISEMSGTPVIGISMDIIGKLNLPIHKAVWEGLKLTWHITEGTAVGFYNLIRDSVTGKGSMDSLTGPIGIVGVVGDAREFGFIYLLSFTALISVNLAVINLIPFPALDGGQLLFLLIEKIKGSPIKPVIANWANTIGFGILMLLMAVITFHDIVKLF